MSRRHARSGGVGTVANVPSALTVLYAANNGPTNVAETSFTDKACETSALTAGRTWWVMYGGCCGADNSSRNTDLQILHGATSIGTGGGEAASTTVTATNSPGLRGGTILTGVGSTLKIQAKTTAGTGQCQALWIVAVDITDIAASVHSSINDTTTELFSNISTASDTDVADQTWNFGVTPAKWLIFGSFEADFDAFTAGRSTAGRMLVGGTVTNSYQSKEGEDAADIYNYAFCTMQTLSGSVRVQLQALGGGTAESDIRRVRLFAIPLASFTQAITDQWAPAARQTTTNASPQSITDLSNAYTPTVAGAYLLAILSTNSRSSNSGNQALFEIYDSTNTTSYCVDSGEGCNNTGDDLPVLLAAALQPSGAITILPRLSNTDGITTASVPSNNNEKAEFILVECAR